MKIYFLPDARKELLETMDYYESQVVGLGERFLKEVQFASRLISDFPELGKPFSTSTRSKLLKRFPYGIIYQIRSEVDIRIIALMHLKKKPGYWKGRT